MTAITAKGWRIRLICVRDVPPTTSPAASRNKYNPDSTKAVRYGEPTFDEMMIGWIDYSTDAEKGLTTATAGERR